MIIVTGAAGFIGSCLINQLNAENFNFIVAVDDFSDPRKQANLVDKRIQEYVDREGFFGWLDQNYQEVEFIFHIGARTDTTEFNWDILEHLNLEYSKQIWNRCIDYQIPLVYASSAATYGLGEHGYDDNESIIPQLQPLNPYGDSKNRFDIWVLEQERQPFFWAGLKFFNVYGPNEYHKDRMASVIFHTYQQILKTGKMNLFRSHNPEFADGEQMRDFVYVKDVLSVCSFLMHHRRNSGIYNLGSGKARTFYDLAANTFRALDLEPNIGFIDTPVDIRDKYQYFTQANMAKLRSIGYDKPFCSLEEGIHDYVVNYLKKDAYL
ncbi:ADP-glyceromanno-heptose 6-epimerase [Spirosoma sp. KUDC1026]|uniref:ADP-glyceromanno-heptose 6-epimerase n=1 Tax=Spirosoma sp. KUDC1026 TaxID=2745947 RepID=UPI00159BB8CE|nr:ADP-glyceromanno-heptose 6-epimerase [Spirosoma sp. KUDC1026]QKZ15305.1 ADP-glyceromanno-heptose 6-epimerase [Spirosoma sp. KUDC1026]